MLTGDANNADPVCDKSPYHQELIDDVERINALAEQESEDKVEEKPLIFRNMKNSKQFVSEAEETA